MSPLWSRALRRWLIGAPIAWLGVFFLGPLLIALAVSFAEVVDGAPPFRLDTLGLTAWRLIAGDDLYLFAFLSSLRIAATVTVLAALLAYPMAYAIARAPERWRPGLLLLVMLPFWTSFLIRIYAWTALLRPTGLINETLIALGIIGEPLALIDNEFAVHLGLVYVYLPFMVLPLYAAIERLDPAFEEAAADLGARPWTTFVTVTLPLTWPGLAAGALLVFIPASAEFIVPEMLGGADVNLIGRALWTEFFGNRDWPAAAALAIALIVVLAGPILLFQRLESRS